MKNQHLVCLFLGIAVTVLFFVFRVSAYESIYSVQGFSDQFFNADLYDMIPLLTIVIPWAAAGIYYYAINSVRFDRWYHWLVVLAVVMVVTPIVGYLINSSKFDELGVSYVAESITFELVNMVWAALLFVVASFSIRWWSSNCRHTPIPQ
ncbi:MAG: hypothetical protein IJT30_08240 [Muribaculaceae bacterium]|nr:hypothetical protein [Muribaculaceae bacterium]